jgi:hypothetical protein
MCNWTYEYKSNSHIHKLLYILESNPHPNLNRTQFLAIS